MVMTTVLHFPGPSGDLSITGRRVQSSGAGHRPNAGSYSKHPLAHIADIVLSAGERTCIESLQQGFEVGKPTSPGMQLVSSLTVQLKGTMQVQRMDSGTAFEIVFPR